MMKVQGLIDLALILILVSNAKGKDWDINVTQIINVTLGSDVTIPCTFISPPEQRTPNVQVYWKKLVKSSFNTYDKDPHAFVYHKNITYVLEKYRGRTQLVGNTANQECSLKIRNITENDRNIYVRVIAKADNYSFYEKPVSIFVSGSGVVPVSLKPDIVPTSFPDDETTMPKTSAGTYTAIFVPIAALLIIIFIVGTVFCIKHKRPQSFTREDSGYYANFSRASSEEAKRDAYCKNHDKKPPVLNDIDLKATADPVYINMKAPPDQMDQSMDQMNNIYANVDYSR